MSVSYRTVENTIGETGVGVDDRVVVEHQIGATIDGVFVPFATMSAERVEVLARAEQARQDAEKSASEKHADKKADAAK